MNDLEQINDVLLRYATGIDRRDWDLFRTCFTEGSKLDYGDLGQWDNREAVTRFMIRSHSGPSMHRLNNFAISIDGDAARARTYVDALVYGPGSFGGAHSIGYYDDELTRTPEGWRIARRRYTGVRINFIGLLGLIVPGWIAARVAAFGARRLNSAVKF
jgi:hypothetical protein